MSSGTEVVALGGGHGLSRTLRALATLPVGVSAVVTVADDGGSSGRLRRDHGVIAFGDIRMALLALAGADDVARLLGHRFASGEVEGHSLGNLALLALVEQHGGDVEAALSAASSLLACRGPVWPCTTVPVTLAADVDGTPVEGQVAVATAGGHRRTVWLVPPDPAPAEGALTALAAADVVVLGPGSLYTSIIPNLLVPGIAAAVAAARVVYVANLTAQPGETEAMDAQAHVDALLDHLPPGTRVEVLRHAGPAPGAVPAPLDGPVLGPRVSAVHTADLAEGEGAARTAGHDVTRLAAAFREVLDLPGG